ncbi:uncharacterized protein LOC121846784 [Oncorhynchus tshawytscha]|uniref:uncharacterized protein LOC121846784 n=1 Tax=Oncorhynchus tshawytscha TaxID=74940 RepID=UPI001C3D9767|nr:uncharacterized protein LOC121846784 [Oncorhynchus tshawytscha]
MSSKPITYHFFGRVSSKSMLTMLHYALVYMAYHTSRWLPRNERLKFQIINAVFVALVLIPQLFVLTRPKSSRYCQQPLLNNLTAFIIMSFMSTGFAVTFTLIDPVPQSFRAAYHGFGLVSFVQGLCTIVLTLTAQQCTKTTPELYYLSLILSLACILSTAFFLVKGGFWVKTNRLPRPCQRGNNG